MAEPGTNLSFLEFLPVSLFGAVMGLSGLSFAWGWAEKVWGFQPWIRNSFGILAVLLFLILTIAYLVKCWRYPALVKAEFLHPVSVSFFGTFIISLLLLPGILLPYSPGLATGIWAVGAALMFFFAWMVLRKWLEHQQEPANALPAWIIPVVGTLDVPIVGYRLNVPDIHEVCLLFFGIGLIFGLILITIVLSRLLFHPPLPEAIQPSLLILVGPFALALTVYDSLTGSHDLVEAVFYYFDLFLLLLLGSKVLLIAKCCPFRVTWWGVSFPLAAITIASFRYASRAHSSPALTVPALLLTITTVATLFLLIQSLYRLLTNRLLLPNPVSEKATRILEPSVRPIQP